MFKIILFDDGILMDLFGWIMIKEKKKHQKLINALIFIQIDD